MEKNMSLLKTKGNTNFQINDILRIKDSEKDEWLRVEGINGNTYIVTRDLAGTYLSNNNPSWKAGTSITNYGVSGKGLIYMTASDENSPYLSVVTHTGSPWSSLTTQLRLGNLNGFLGYVTSLYGIGIGTTSSYLKYDAVSGLQIKGSVTITGGNASVTYYQDNPPGSSGDLNTPKDGDYWVDTNDNNALYVYNTSAGGWQEITSGGPGGITTFRATATPTSLTIGDLWIKTDTGRLYRAAIVGADQIVVGEWEEQQTTLGTTPSIGAGLYLGSDYLGYYNSTAWKVYIKSDGKFYFGGDGTNYLEWDGSDLNLRGTLNATDIDAGTLSADRIAAGSITTDKLTVGTLTGFTIRTSAVNPRVELTGASLKVYDAGGNVVVVLGDLT
jgi:hypothetical protein